VERGSKPFGRDVAVPFDGEEREAVPHTNDGLLWSHVLQIAQVVVRLEGPLELRPCQDKVGRRSPGDRRRRMPRPCCCSRTR